MSSPQSIHTPYPWQQTSWQRIQQQIARHKPPHALLLSGQQGIGKWHFAQALAAYLLCLSPRDGLACGQCRSCQLLLANTHPDKQIYEPEEPAKPIKIAQIRHLSAFISNTAFQGGRKVVLLNPVEQLNVNAANALLKNLEEPPENTVFILVSHIASAVLATIRSRCQLLPLLTPSRAVATQWLTDLPIANAEALLDLAGGAPLSAKQMAQDDYLEHLLLFMRTLHKLAQQTDTVPNITLAKDCLALHLSHISQWWLYIIHRILCRQPHLQQAEDADIQQGGNVTDSATTDIAACMESLLLIGKHCNRQWLFKFSDKLILLRRQQLQGAKPNMQLLIEELLLDWQLIVQRC